MLLGRPPFETTNLKETYKCIREARYSLPSSLSPQAKQLIASLLAKIPEDRPNLDHILRHDFFTQVRHHWLLHSFFWLFDHPSHCQIDPFATTCTLTHFLPLSLCLSPGLQSRASAGELLPLSTRFPRL